MTRLDQSQVAGGIMGIYPDIQFDVQNADFGGGDGGNAGNFTPVPTLYYVHSLSSDLKLGLGVGSYFGLGVDYGNDWAGRYYVQSASYETLAVNPTIAYQITPWLSVGGGASIVRGEMKAKVAVSTLLEPGDGRLRYDATDVGYGFDLGVLFEVSSRTRLGLTYVSEVDLEFKDDLRFNNLDGTILGGSPGGKRADGFPVENRLHHPQPGSPWGLSCFYRQIRHGGVGQLAGLE